MRVAMVAALVTGGAASADEVVLNNGDRITGTVVELAGGTLSVKTDYAGVVKIDWSVVDMLSTDAPIYVTIGDNRVRAMIIPGAAGTAMLSSEDWLETDPIALSRVSNLTYKPKPAIRVTGRVNIGASSSSGNTNAETLHANAEVVARSDQNRFTAGGRANRAKNDGTQTESNWLAYLKYDHFVSRRWYISGNMNAENDKFKDINLRTTIGLGTGYQLRDTDRTKLSFEAGVNYVNTDFILAADKDYPAARWALDYAQKLFSTESEFFHRHELFSSLDKSDNLFARTQTGLRLPVVDRLNSTIQYNYDWDDNPAPGRLKADKTWLFTLGYTW